MVEARVKGRSQNWQTLQKEPKSCFWIKLFMNIQVWSLKLSFLLGKYLGMDLLSHMVSEYLTLWETAILFSKGTVPFCFATSNDSSTPSPTLGTDGLLNFSYSSRCEEISHWLESYLTDAACCPCSLLLFLYSLVKCLFWSFVHFLIELLILLSSYIALYILETDICLSDVCFAVIFCLGLFIILSVS